LPQRVIYR
jgi:serine/threonine protein kinase